MISLLLSILSSTIILIVFKIIEKQKINLFPPIVINYIAASTLGFSLNGNALNFNTSAVSPWILFSIIIGIMLIGNFYLLGRSTQKAGIGITTVSAKMSFVLPVMFSLIFDINDQINIPKAILIAFAVASVFLVIFPGQNSKAQGSIIYPSLIFFALGLLDTLVKYCQYHFISTPEKSSLFSAINFSIAGIIGVLLILSSKKNLLELKHAKVWLIGTILGIANFGSMYFLINALNALKFNNSLVFGINNIGIVVLSVIIAFVVYKERFSKTNWIGLLLALIVLIGMIRIF